MSTADFSRAGYETSAIAENRAGRLTPSQSNALLAEQRGQTYRYLIIVAAMIVGVAVGGRRFAANLPPQAHTIVLAVMIVPIVVVLLLTYSIASKVRHDVRDGKVLSIEGRARRGRHRGRDKNYYHLWINEELLNINLEARDLIDPSLTYRALYLPRTKTIVNLETIG
jgi:hypothetical protein